MGFKCFIRNIWLFCLIFPSKVFSQKLPNFLCIVCEDIGQYLGCYGDHTVPTPNIDKLGSEGIIFTRMFTTVGVSAPSRAGLITGMYPTSIGANQMRCYSPSPGYKALPEGISQYEVVLPEGVKCYTEFLRAKGYYCTNNNKTDYQFAPPLTAWDENSATAHWKNRPQGAPFFSIFNLNITHESQIWERSKAELACDPKTVPLPPYYPDDKIVRHDVAVMYSNIHEMDKQVKKLIDELIQENLLDSTIVIFYSDNGGPLPNQKREIYDRGTLVPFMIRFPDGFRKGETTHRLCSFIDIPATILSLAGIKPPAYMQGQAFLGKYESKQREYIFGARNRMDEQIDKQGFARDAKFRYVRNYMTENPDYMPVEYRMQMPMMKRLIQLYERDSLDPDKETWFRFPRENEEFYDLDKDPFELKNLIHDKNYFRDIDRLRKAYSEWDKKYNQLWKLEEKECREIFWPDNVQPVVKNPEFSINKNGLEIKCTTGGASIAYQFEGQEGWLLYTKPINSKRKIRAIAVRAGYRNSEIVEYNNSNQ
ncbi:MAG: sulfatase-like hydrolase/transferase [Bacteroidales bacterium]